MTAPSKRRPQIMPGDTVMFARSHLRSTGQYTGDPAPTDAGPFARGTFVQTHPEMGSRFAYVKWDNGRERIVAVSALWPVGIPEPA